MYDVIKTKKVTLEFLSRNDVSSVPKILQMGLNVFYDIWCHRFWDISNKNAYGPT